MHTFVQCDLRREKKLEKMAQFLGWDESNFLRLQSMLGGAAAPSMHSGQNVLILFQKLTSRFQIFSLPSCHIKSQSVVLLEQIQFS